MAGGHIALGSGGAVLKGGDLLCTPEQDGLEMQVRGITDHIISRESRLRIQCKCIRGVVRCERKENHCAQELRGCHYIQESRDANAKCQYECRPCSDNSGNIFRSGQIWPEAIMNATARAQCPIVNQCFSGVITQSKQSCPPPMCANPVLEPGHCCPSCKGCSRAGQLFAEGESKQDVTDPCNKCTCNKGSLTCVRQTCPVLPCPPRLIRKAKPGQCCPECVRFQPFSGISNMCSFRGKVYRVGAKYKPDECTTCTCTRSLTTLCKKASCPTLSCPLMYQRRIAGKCCAYCSASYNKTGNVLAAVRPPVESGLIPKPPQTCQVKDQTYQEGQSWSQGCQKCTCSGGEVKCGMPECPVTSCPPGADLVPPAGGSKDCCPTCKFREGVCTVFGDPHYKTFDGRIFNFQGSCKYLLAQECNPNHVSPDAFKPGNGGNSSSDFSVRITNDARASSAFSWTRTITIRLHGMKVTLLQKLKVKIDGKRVSLPHIKLGSLSIMKDGYRVVVRTNEGVRILWDGVSFLEITVPAKYRDRMCGLCGNFNGDKFDDFHGRRGNEYGTGQQFGDSWRVGGYRACSILPKDMPRSYEPHCSQTWESKIKSDRSCNALHSSLFEKCSATSVDPEYYFDACKFDMCECPGDQCHCEVLTAYARECERAGHMVHGWREATNCKNVTSYAYKRRNNRRNQQKLKGLESNDVLLESSRKDHKGSRKNHKKNRRNDNAKRKSDNNKAVDWSTSKAIEEDVEIGEFLAACSPNTASFCQGDQAAVKLNRLRKRNMKPKLTRSQRRKLRRQRKRERQRKRRKERRKKKRRKQRRDKRRKRKRKEKKRGREVTVRKQDLDRLDRVGVVVQQVHSEETGEVKRRLNWSKFKSNMKIPPFESLLTSFEDVLNSTKEEFDYNDEFNNNEDEENQDYEALEELFNSTSAIVRNIGNSDDSNDNDKGNRVPLPLLEDERIRGHWKGHGDLRMRHKRSPSGPNTSSPKTEKLVSNFFKTWKRRRRRDIINLQQNFKDAKSPSF